MRHINRKHPMHYYLLIVSNNDVPMISYRQFSKELILSAVPYVCRSGQPMLSFTERIYRP